MVPLGIIAPEPATTALISIHTYPRKANESIDLCLDLKALIKAISIKIIKPLQSKKLPIDSQLKSVLKLDAYNGLWSVDLHHKLYF